MSDDFVKNPAKPDRCVGCPLYHAPGPVPGFGPLETDLVFVGEAPGADEVSRTKRPFTGGSGRVLRKVCADLGIDLSTAFITNCVRCRPTVLGADGTPKDRPPTKVELAHCAPFLAEEIRARKPNLIVALGASALLVFKNRDEIGKFRGQCFLTETGQKVLAAYHPAHLMRMQHLFPLFHEDLKKAISECKSPLLSRLEVSYRTYNPGAGDLDALYHAALDAGFLVEDLETTGLDRRRDSILCCGFGTRPTEAECYTWTPTTAEFVRRAHSDPRIEIIGQNTESFDLPFLEAKGVPYPVGPRFDTLLSSHLISADTPKDLGTQGSLYTDREYWKDKGRLAKSLQETMEYCCEDIDGTCRSYLTQKRELSYLGMDELFARVMRLQPVLRKMTRLGIRKNTTLATKWAIAFDATANAKEEMLRRVLKDPFFSVNSPKQLMKLFYEDLGLPVQYTRDKNRGMRPTANAEAMEKLAEISDDPIFLEVNKVRTLRKWKSTYCEIEADENNFVHPEFGSAKAANGRLNSWDPNAQNIPVELREMLVADTEDHVIVSADWSQVEWRVEMCEASDEVGLQMFADGLDIHRTAATGFTGRAYADVDDFERHAMKFVVYGLLYGRSAASVAKQTKQEKSVVENQIGGFFKTFPAVRAHMNRIEALLRRQNFLRNPFSRRRWWFTKMITEAYNFGPSSTAADMMYIALIRLDEQLPKSATLRLSVHDEVDVMCPKDHTLLKQTTECVRDVMQSAYPEVLDAAFRPEVVRRFYPQGWYVPCDMTIGNNWKQCKPKTKEEKSWQANFQHSLGISL